MSPCECSSYDGRLDESVGQVAKSIPDIETCVCAQSEDLICCKGGIDESTEARLCTESCRGSEQVSIPIDKATCAGKCSSPTVGAAACAANRCCNMTPVDSCGTGCCPTEIGALKGDKLYSSTVVIDGSLPSVAVACTDSCCSEGPAQMGFSSGECCTSYISNSKTEVDERTNAVGVDGCCSHSSHPHASVVGKDKSCSVKRRNHNHCASSVFGRFYEIACCDPSNNAKRKIHAPNCKRRPTVENRSPKPSKVVFNERRDIKHIEPSSNDHTRAMMMSVRGMDCQSCATRVTKALLTIPSVANLKVDTFSGQVSLTYLDTVVTPENIVLRAATLTGYRCELQPITGASQEKRIAVQVSTTDNLYDANLPNGIVVKSMRKHESGGAILEIEYDSWMMQPREVISSFALWHGVHVPRSSTEDTDEAKKSLTNLLQRTIVSVICCIPVLVFSWAPIPRRPIVYGSISLVLTTIIQCYVAAPLYSSAFRSLFLQRIIDMDLLVAMSTSIAYIFSVVAFGMEAAHRPSLNEFFETSSLLVTLITGGDLASAYARRRASSTVDSLASLQVRTVDFVDDDGFVTPLSDELVHIGDIVRVMPESTIPTDGFVVSGTSEVDESSITGESIPVEKREGSKLIAGTLNLSGLLYMSVKRLPSENTVAGITRLMREAQDSRLPVQDLPDKVASYLAPFILVLSTVTFIAWLLVGLYVRHESGSNAAVNALKYAITVMVITCPCAIVLAVPMVIVISVAVCAKHGILFKTIQAIQHVEGISAAVFDKTGTLTEGKLLVIRSQLLRDDAVALVLALTSNSRHPVASAVAAHLLATPVSNRGSSIKLKDTQSIAGKGLEATHADLSLRGGNPKWLEAEDYYMVHELLKEGLTPFVAMHGEEIIAVFGLADTIRQGSQDTIDLIERGGAEVYIVSGDEQAVVNDVAARLGIPSDHAFGNCTPQTKQEHVRRLQATSGNGGVPKVAFFGDGTNDSLALVQADIGISFGSGTDVALNAADVIILDPSNMARSIKTILRISRGAVLRIKMNIVWSIVYNVTALLLAGGAFVHARISPQYAGLGELVSVMPVILVAWTLWLLRV